MNSVATLPIGTRVMLSMPLASTMSCVPDSTACAANIIACCDEPHWRSMVTAGIESGRFDASTALRPRSIVCWPPCDTQPVMTSSIALVSKSLRSAIASNTAAPRSTG